jgi:hypothetical protein
MHKMLIVTMLCFLFFAQASVSKKDVIYPEPRTSGEGQLWLAWNPQQRQNFVSGFLEAYAVGFRAGCLQYSFADPSGEVLDLNKSPLQKCMLQQLSFGKPANAYAEAITSFYNRFPTDSDVPNAWLILAFSDSENKTPEQIDVAWREGHRHP